MDLVRESEWLYRQDLANIRFGQLPFLGSRAISANSPDVLLTHREALEYGAKLRRGGGVFKPGTAALNPGKWQGAFALVATFSPRLCSAINGKTIR